MDSDATLFVPPYKQVFWGLIVSSVLYGMTLIQAFVYYSHSNGRDGLVLRVIVAVLVALDTADTITSALAVQEFLIDNWGNKAILPILPPTLTAELFISLFIVVIVQLFFARQIFRFAPRSWPWCLLIVICSVTGGIMTFVFSIHSFKVQEIDVANQKPWKYLVTVPSILSTVIDLLAALLLTLLLGATQGEYRIKQTENIIKRILLFTVTRALLLAAIQLTFVVIYLTIPASQDWAPFRLMVAKVYVNTFLAMLNSRDALARKDTESFSISQMFSKFSSGRATGITFNTPPAEEGTTLNSTDMETTSPERSGDSLNGNKQEEERTNSLNAIVPKT